MLMNEVRYGGNSMKLKKMWITLIAIFSLGMIGSIATIKLANPVQAKINVSVFPKKMRGTWYQYDKQTHLVNKETITAKKWIFYEDNGKKSIYPLHVLPKNGSHWNKMSKKKDKWMYIVNMPVKVHGHTWLAIRGWYEMTAGPFFTVSKLKGHQVLTNAAGYLVTGANHWYHSVKLAKKLKNKHYAHFVY